MQIIQSYSTGQNPNLNKFGLFFSKSALRDLQGNISTQLGIQIYDRSVKYMGNP